MLEFTTLLELADKLSLINAVKTKLLRNPDAAAEKLVVVLDELFKVYYAFETELNTYLGLEFDPADDLQNRIGVLETMAIGPLEIRVSEARGHCHKIRNIYQTYLDRWFHDRLTPTEAQMLREVFALLSDFDLSVVYELSQMAQWVSDHAAETLELVEAEDYEEANAQIRTARREIFPTRRAITHAMAKIRDLQADFIEMSGQI